jgi:hypothetical protein
MTREHLFAEAIAQCYSTPSRHSNIGTNITALKLPKLVKEYSFLKCLGKESNAPPSKITSDNALSASEAYQVQSQALEPWEFTPKTSSTPRHYERRTYPSLMTTRQLRAHLSRATFTGVADHEKNDRRSVHFLHNLSDAGQDYSCDLKPRMECEGYNTLLKSSVLFKLLSETKQGMEFEAYSYTWGTPIDPLCLILEILLSLLPRMKRRRTFHCRSVIHGQISKHQQRQCHRKLGTKRQKSKTPGIPRIWNCVLFSSENGTDSEDAASPESWRLGNCG